MLRSLCLALLAALAVAAPAQAASWLEPASPFGDAPAREGDADVAMAPDGTIVVARFAPDGTLEVRERPPGGPFGAAAIIPVPDEPRDPPALEVLAGDYGTVAVLFDAGGERYASLRPPRGTWSDPQVVGAAGADPGQAAVAPDGVLWAVGEDPADPRALTVTQLAADGDETFTPLPAPPAGARDVAAALDVP